MNKYLVATLFAVLLVLITACGGGYKTGVDLPGFDLSKQYMVVSFPDSGQPGKQTVTFEITMKDYAKCGNGHAGLMMRADLDAVNAGGPYVGHGLVWGTFGTNHHNTRKLPDPPTPLYVVQTWAGPKLLEDVLLTPTISAMTDGTYIVTVISEKTDAGNTIQYQVNDYDSGVVIDSNPNLNMGRDSLAFFNAGDTPLCPYTLSVQALNVLKE
jgi:hypothetical protein